MPGGRIGHLIIKRRISSRKYTQVGRSLDLDARGSKVSFSHFLTMVFRFFEYVYLYGNQQSKREKRDDIRLFRKNEGRSIGQSKKLFNTPTLIQLVETTGLEPVASCVWIFDREGNGVLSAPSGPFVPGFSHFSVLSAPLPPPWFFLLWVRLWVTVQNGRAGGFQGRDIVLHTDMRNIPYPRGSVERSVHCQRFQLSIIHLCLY